MHHQVYHVDGSMRPREVRKCLIGWEECSQIGR